ncbi:hypothetical protein [Scytonema millei]|uniref:Uncharacterized protein n=1 Tax=Scytonema millei VB511283 TaxID=1245923 RepID=A0A9X5E9W8_9CYAN|nr:hypothetical protein [Scytonema millei]NHC37961.1 hypothetical protein [Scytonema millei VB511283]
MREQGAGSREQGLRELGELRKLREKKHSPRTTHHAPLSFPTPDSRLSPPHSSFKSEGENTDL